VILIPDLFGMPSLWVSGRDLGGVLGLEVTKNLLFWRNRLLKRILDLILALLAMPLVLVSFVIVGLLIRIDSPGPVFFLQERPGERGRPFKIWKFRTMHVDAERRLNSLSPEFLEEFWRYGKIRNDPRITRVGYWLRKYSLDELPQIINVLRGEMSLVGPRPYLFSQLKQLGLYSNEIFSVKPGLTGLWQISGRSEVTTEERVSMDTYYIRNWSIWMDLYILARTVWVVLTRKGAY